MVGKYLKAESNSTNTVEEGDLNLSHFLFYILFIYVVESTKPAIYNKQKSNNTNKLRPAHQLHDFSAW